MPNLMGLFNSVSTLRETGSPIESGGTLASVGEQAVGGAGVLQEESIPVRVAGTAEVASAAAGGAGASSDEKQVAGFVNWQAVFARDFPHLYSHINRKKDIDWKAQYHLTERKEYSSLRPEMVQLFRLVKASDSSLLTQSLNPFQLDQCTDRYGKTLIAWARIRNNQALLNHLYRLASDYYRQVGAPSKLDTKKKINRRATILYWAIELNQPAETVSELLEQVSLGNEVYSPHGQTPIHLAAAYGRLDLITLLLEKFPHWDLINSKDAYEQDPLLIATMYGQDNAVDMLLMKGASLDSQSWSSSCESSFNGYTALDWAIYRFYEKIAIRLINHAVAENLFFSDCDNFTSLHYAAHLGLVRIVRAIVERFPDFVNRFDGRGRTAIDYAAMAGHFEVVKYLSQHPDILIDTACQLAKKNGHKPIVDLLNLLPGDLDHHLPVSPIETLEDIDALFPNVVAGPGASEDPLLRTQKEWEDFKKEMKRRKEKEMEQDGIQQEGMQRRAP